MENAVMLSADQLPALPDDGPVVGLPPPVMSQNFGGMRPPQGIPRFFVEAVRKPGGDFDQVEMVEIITPGDAKAMPVRKVSAGIIEKYRPWYDQWKRQQTMAPIGTPLEMWPRMSGAAHLVYELKSKNIHTVEQLADIADSNLSSIPMGRTLKNEAAQFVQAKDKSEVIEKATAQAQALQDSMRMMEGRFETEKAAMKAENADLKAKLDAILLRLGAPEEPVQAGYVAVPDAAPPASRRGPGRPPKQAEAA